MLLDLVAPRLCPGCGTGPRAPCAACVRALTGPARAHVPDPCPPGLPDLRAVAAFDGPVRGLLLAYKERGRLGLTGTLAAALAAAAAPFRPEVLVPLPSSRAARRARGYDHVGLLARRAARELGGMPVVPVVRRVRATSDQSGLGAAARASNVAGAFAVDRRLAERVRGRRLVVVDDVVTTGASLAEAARALRAAGLPPCGAAVVAARQRRPDGAAAGSGAAA